MNKHHLIFRALSDAVSVQIIELLIQKPAHLKDFDIAFGMPRPTLQKN